MPFFTLSGCEFALSKKDQRLPLYICRIPHNMQDYKDKAYVLPFSKWAEGIFLLFNTLECIDILSDTLSDILPDKTD